MADGAGPPRGLAKGREVVALQPDGVVIAGRIVACLSSLRPFLPTLIGTRVEVGDLEAIDFIESYWMGPAVAHLFISFGFRGGEHLAVSIATRKVRDEGYSAMARMPGAC